MFEIKSTGASISSSSIYPAAKIEAFSATRSEDEQFNQAGSRLDRIRCCVHSVLIHSPTDSILTHPPCLRTAVEIPDDALRHSAEIGTIIIMTDQRLPRFILISLAGRNNETEGENHTMAAAAIIKRSLWRVRNYRELTNVASAVIVTLMKSH